MSNKTYDFFKWTAMVGLPAVAVFASAIGSVWNIPSSEAISFTIVAVSTLIGTWVGVSGVNYAAKHRKEDSQDE